MPWSPTSSTSTWEPNFDIAETGGALFGHQDVARALREGATRAQIKSYIERNKDTGKVAASNIEGGGGDSNLYSDVTTTETGPKNQWGGEFYGEADRAFDRDTSLGDARASNIQIRDYIGGDEASHFNAAAYHGGNEGYQGTINRVVDNAVTEGAVNTNRAQQVTIDEQGTQLGTLQTDYENLSGQYSNLQSRYDEMGTQYTQLQADVAQAAKDALKIKYTGSTAVQNPSAMGIQAAQGTPFRGSGLAGTAALARPNKGLKIKTLNV